MNLSIPTVAAQAGGATGGGLLSSLTGGAAGAKQAGGTKGDGSVGLFDGVMLKAGLGGAIGAGIGFLLPGGPILAGVGGVLGALAGAGYGMFKNWKQMKAIKEENAAFLAAAGIQPQTQQQAEALLSGQPQQMLGEVPGQVGQVGQTAQIPGQVGQATQTGAPPQTGIPSQSGAPGQTGQVPGQTGQVPQTTPIQLDEASQKEFDRLKEQYVAQQTGQVGQATQQAPPPPAIDTTTQPVNQGLAQVAPKQAELAAVGGGGLADGPSIAEQAAARTAEHEARILKIWSYADDEGKEILMKRMQEKLEALEALVERLKAQRSAA